MQSRNINSSIDTLRSTIEPPPEHIVAASFQELSSLGAITEDGMFSCSQFAFMNGSILFSIAC